MSPDNSSHLFYDSENSTSGGQAFTPSSSLTSSTTLEAELLDKLASLRTSIHAYPHPTRPTYLFQSPTYPDPLISPSAQTQPPHPPPPLPPPLTNPPHGGASVPSKQAGGHTDSYQSARAESPLSTDLLPSSSDLSMSMSNIPSPPSCSTEEATPSGSEARVLGMKEKGFVNGLEQATDRSSIDPSDGSEANSSRNGRHTKSIDQAGEGEVDRSRNRSFADSMDQSGVSAVERSSGALDTSEGSQEVEASERKEVDVSVSRERDTEGGEGMGKGGDMSQCTR